MKETIENVTTVNDVLELVNHEIDVEDFILFAEFIAKKKSTPSEIVEGLKEVKTIASNVSLPAAREVLVLYGMNPLRVAIALWNCDSDLPRYLRKPFTLESHRIVENDWALPQVEDGSWELIPEDIIDLESFASRLMQPSSADKLSQFFHTMLMESPARDLLSNYKGGPDDELKKALINEINRLCNGNDSFYDPYRFSGVRLSAETLGLLAEDPRFDILRRNRKLLEDAYPSELSKKRKLTKLSDNECWQKGYMAIAIVKELMGNVALGSPVAAEVCGKIVINMVQILNDMKRANPCTFFWCCSHEPQWPVLRSPHPFYCESEKPLLDDVGKNYDFMIDRFAKWNPGDSGTKIARELFLYVKDLREKCGYFLRFNEAHEKRRLSPQEIWVSRVANLPDWNKDTAKVWWNVARDFLKYTYPDPIKIPDLAILGTLKPDTLRRGPTRTSKKRTPGEIRRDIFNNIKGKFISLAGR